MFCRKCGKPIPDDSRFCPACGSPTDSTSFPMQEANALSYTLTIDRASQVFLVSPPIKVTIDSTIHLSVENGHTESVQIQPGKHSLLFKCSLRSTQLDIDLQKDTVIELSWNRVTGKIATNIL